MNDDKIQKMNVERLQNYSDALYKVIFERYKIFPQISTLSSALIVLVMQATDLVKTKSLALVSLIILLSLIPISLFSILSQLGENANVLSERIENILQSSINSSKINNFWGFSPWIIFFFFPVAIILIILSLFNLNKLLGLGN